MGILIKKTKNYDASILCLKNQFVRAIRYESVKTSHHEYGDCLHGHINGCSKEAPKTEEIPYVMVTQPSTTQTN